MSLCWPTYFLNLWLACNGPASWCKANLCLVTGPLIHLDCRPDPPSLMGWGGQVPSLYELSLLSCPVRLAESPGSMKKKRFSLKYSLFAYFSLNAHRAGHWYQWVKSENLQFRADVWKRVVHGWSITPDLSQNFWIKSDACPVNARPWRLYMVFDIAFICNFFLLQILVWILILSID